MTAAVLALVLIAAVLHAVWNVLAKRAQPASATVFVWLCSALGAILYVPAVAVLLLVAPPHHPFTLVDVGFVVVTAAFHIAYFVLLQRGYRDGDLSLVYPLARGTGPLVASLAAVAFLGERPGLLGTTGIAAIVAGIFIATGATLRSPRVRISTAYGVATGCAIAAYTVWDKEAVSALAIAPILYDFGRTALQAAVMTPFVWTASRRRAAVETWQRCRREALGIAVLSPISYILVLYALVTAPVTVVAPAREISIVFGAILGARLFNEGYGLRRAAAAILMLAGIIALARS
jgi:drug/metabolite transporter (DMT)-like permease